MFCHFSFSAKSSWSSLAFRLCVLRFFILDIVLLPLVPVVHSSFLYLFSCLVTSFVSWFNILLSFGCKFSCVLLVRDFFSLSKSPVCCESDLLGVCCIVFLLLNEFFQFINFLSGTNFLFLNQDKTFGPVCLLMFGKLMMMEKYSENTSVFTSISIVEQCFS